MEKQIELLLKVFKSEDASLDETKYALLNLLKVRRSAMESANLISALNNTLLANKEVGTYKSLETKCLEKLSILINEIEEQQA